MWSGTVESDRELKARQKARPNMDGGDSSRILLAPTMIRALSVSEILKSQLEPETDLKVKVAARD